MLRLNKCGGSFAALVAAAAASVLAPSARALAAGNSPLKPFPVAKRVPTDVRFGVVEGENRGVSPMSPAKVVVDDYFWIRDDARKDEEVLSLLRSENAFTASQTDRLADFRGALYDEMLSHVNEDDETVPYTEGDFEYFSRTKKGVSFTEYVRRKPDGGVEEVYLDVNAEALKLATPSMCDVGEHEVSPSGALLAYAVDGTGYETYDIVIRDIATGKEKTRIEGTAGGIAWADDETLFYVRHDTVHRPYQVWRHTAEEEVLVFEEQDELFNVGCGRDRDGSLIWIETESKETTELRFVATADPTAPAVLVRGREFGVKYDATSHRSSKSMLLSSNADGLKNRALYRASLTAPSEWLPLGVLPHSEDRSIDRIEAFQDFAAVTGREGGFTQIWTVGLDSATAAVTTAADRVSFDAESFYAGLGANAEFATTQLRIVYSSMTSPKTTYDLDWKTQKKTVLKTTKVPNYDADKYETERLECPSRDGETTIPVTLLRLRDDQDKTADEKILHLYGYGSYGACMDPTFSSSRLALVDRGVTFAIAHVRGGGEMGHAKWYEQEGKYLTKRNTFLDYMDCAQHLKATGHATTMSIEGRSAGGLLVGNAVNMDTEGLFSACIAGVPFVDLMVSMCDPSIPLTTEEWEEWGNPNEETYFEYMMSYSPIDNVREGATYPKMLLVSGLNDPRVAYWEPTKWAQVLRSKIANAEDVLLKMDLEAGHFSASDRYKYLRELAFDYAWLLDVLGKSPEAKK